MATARSRAILPTLHIIDVEMTLPRLISASTICRRCVGSDLNWSGYFIIKRAMEVLPCSIESSKVQRQGHDQLVHLVTRVVS